MIGKAELAKALGWSRPRLDRRLDTDQFFPVEKRGTKSGGWQFDLAKVKAYLDPPAVAKPIGQVIDTAQLRDTVKPPAPSPAVKPATHRGEGTARQRKDEADAALKELKLQQLKEETVPRAEVTATVANALALLGKALDGLPDAIAKMLGLPENSVPIIREMVDDFRRECAGNLRELLTTDG